MKKQFHYQELLIEKFPYIKSKDCIFNLKYEYSSKKFYYNFHTQPRSQHNEVMFFNINEFDLWKESIKGKPSFKNLNINEYCWVKLGNVSKLLHTKVMEL